MDTPPEVPAEPVGPFNLPVLKIIIEAQGLHGLRYGDYQRYRSVSSCVRTLLRKAQLHRASPAACMNVNNTELHCACVHVARISVQRKNGAAQLHAAAPSSRALPRSPNLSHLPATCPHDRQYCARRMQRLRKVLNFVHWESGKGKSKFMQREISEETVVDERYLELVLFKAERCWAYAMQLRDPPGGVPVCIS